MTAQIAEKLTYQGHTYSMCTQPLDDYFSLADVDPGFDTRSCTALWRGYVGSWEIRDDRLYLVGLNASRENGSPASLADIFPDFPDRVFAHWYTGWLRVPQGKMLEYKHMGYASVFEEDLFITIDKGVVTDTHVQSNGTSDEHGAPEGYGVGAMTVFPRKQPGEMDEP